MSTLMAFIAFAAEEAEEKSKTVFYIAGGIAAAWAVAVAIYGITHEDFPRDKGAARGVMAFSALVVVGAMATAVATG